MKNLMVAGVFALLAIANVANGMDVICYVTSWSVYKPEPVKYEMSDVDPNLCDIVIYSFYKIENNVISQIESFDNQNLQRLAGLKAMNPNFKVLVAVGGATASHAFPGMVASAHTRKQFIDSCLSLMRTYQVDGIDLDWEYPGWNDKQNFVALVREMRQAFGSQYMITGAFPAGTSTIDGGYDIAALTPNLDYIGVMSYDYNGCWGGNALEHNAPLYAPSGSTIPSLNIDTTMKHYLAKGATADKLVLGLAFYARGMGLSASTANIGDRLGNGYCPQGTYTQTGGFLAYYEICSYKSQGLERRWNEAGKVPFVTGNNRWWGYDDSQSLSEKINYAKAHGFRGVMIWTIDYDDFNNAICSEGRYPMLSHVHTEAKSGGTGPIPTKPPVPPPTTTTTSKPGGGGGSHTVCSCGKQFEPDYQTGCQNYYVCSNGQASYSQACPPGTLFSYNSQACDWPYNVNCQVPCNT